MWLVFNWITWKNWIILSEKNHNFFTFSVFSSCIRGPRWLSRAKVNYYGLSTYFNICLWQTSDRQPVGQLGIWLRVKWSGKLKMTVFVCIYSLDSVNCICIWYLVLLWGEVFPENCSSIVYTNIDPSVHRQHTDLLKVNSFAQPNFLSENFAQRNGPKMP